MKAAVVQLCSTEDLAANLAAAERGVAEAAAAGAVLVALPENFAYLRREGLPIPCAQDLDGEIVGALCGWARRHGIHLLGGSFPERIAGEARVHNTSVLVGPEGRVLAVYRKMHLFDVDLGEQARFTESAHIAPGGEPVLAETALGGIGLSVCYDLRFPELYRVLAQRGAEILCVPAAFAPQTGPDHWEVLLRARAIENQCFVLAPAQCGRHSPERASYGHSRVLDPWGRILARLEQVPGVAVAELDPAVLAEVRRSLPALRHRRL